MIFSISWGDVYRYTVNVTRSRLLSLFVLFWRYLGFSKLHLHYWIADSSYLTGFSELTTAWYMPTYPKMSCALNHALCKTCFILPCNLYKLLSALLSETTQKLFNWENNSFFLHSEREEYQKEYEKGDKHVLLILNIQEIDSRTLKCHGHQAVKLLF